MCNRCGLWRNFRGSLMLNRFSLRFAFSAAIHGSECPMLGRAAAGWRAWNSFLHACRFLDFFLTPQCNGGRGAVTRPPRTRFAAPTQTSKEKSEPDELAYGPVRLSA